MITAVKAVRGISLLDSIMQVQDSRSSTIVFQPGWCRIGQLLIKKPFYVQCVLDMHCLT